jgi:hypothetical protein
VVDSESHLKAVRTGVATGWRLSGVTIAGSSHVDSGRGADDAFAFCISYDRSSVVAVVADGAGSRTGTSAFGSYEACRAVVLRAVELAEAADASDTEVVVRSVFASALTAIEARASELDLQVQELATTLAVAVLTPSNSVFAQIGDGVIVCDLDGTQSSRIPEVKGEYANETKFLTTQNAIESDLRIEHHRVGIRRFALSTDGLRYKILRLQQGGAPFEPFFDAVWAKLDKNDLSAADLGPWLARLDDQTGDDKTLIVGVFSDLGVETDAPTLVAASETPPVPPARDAASESQDPAESSAVSSPEHAPVPTVDADFGSSAASGAQESP